MASPSAPAPQRLTLVSARQEWKKHCVILEGQYRNERSGLDVKATAEHTQSILDLEARHRQEVQDYVRNMTFNEPPATHPPVTDESEADHKPEATMDTQRPDEPIKTEVESPNKSWELYFSTVRPAPSHTPTDLLNDDLDTNSKRKADGDNGPLPKKQRITQSNCDADPIKTIMYTDVRKNAVDNGHWDTIIEWPENSKQFWVCFCEEHGNHFKQKADIAAAKHLAGSLHGLTRDRRPAIVQLGHYIPDCTEELRNIHNAEVNEMFARGYTPRTVLRKANHPPATPSTTTGLITHPKTAHVYYAKYEGQHWAVVILGWDKLPEGCRHTTLGASELIKHDPPHCYFFDGHTKITGWKPNYVDGGKSVAKREFPVMYFDEDLNYGWVPAKDLSRLDLDRANAPKRKGYPEGSYNDARDWIAQRCGHENWESLNATRKGLRAKTSAGPVPVPKPSDFLRSSPRVNARSRESSSEGWPSDSGGMAKEPVDDIGSTEMPSLIRRKSNPIQILSFEESLKRLPAAGHVSQKGHSSRSTPAVDSVPDLQRQATHSSAPPLPAASSAPSAPSAPAVRAASAVSTQTAPVIIPPSMSFPSPQMPTPQTPTPQGQLQPGAIESNQAYEISAFEYQTPENGQVRNEPVWQRASRSEPCARLVISADGCTAQAEGNLFYLVINPPECRQVRLKTPLGEDGLITEHGISYVTIHMTTGGPSVRLTFDRSDDQNGIMGCRRARLFVRWLWGQNPKMKS
ncbi:hypothetical protein PG989_007118 [Apiospora arundinis]